MSEDLERRVTALEQEKAVAQVREAMREDTDKELRDAVKDLRSEVHELKSWKLRLQYPFAIVGVLFIGACTAIGAYIVKIFTGD